MIISFNLQASILLAHATQSHMVDDHPPTKPLAVDSEPEVQLTDQLMLEQLMLRILVPSMT